MSRRSPDFHPALRVLHWLMAAMVLAMLFIGVFMVSTTGPAYVALLDLHRPIGIAILVLVLLRLPLRLATGAPALPEDLAPLQKRIAWGMLSAGGYPVQLGADIVLPPILPHDLGLYALLRTGHTIIALLFFALILLHLAAALMHGLVRRDGVLRSMTTGHRNPRATSIADDDKFGETATLPG
jgi:cytochrome b561